MSRRDVVALTPFSRAGYEAAPVRMRSLFWSIVVVSGLLAACDDSRVADGPEEQTAQVMSCAKLRDHLVELRLVGVETDREQHRRAMVATLGAAANGLTLVEVAAARAICGACAVAIEAAGAKAVTPLKVR